MMRLQFTTGCLPTIIALLQVATPLAAADTGQEAPSGRVACPAPTEYDADARMPPRMADREVVRLRIIIDLQGNVIDAQVVHSTNKKLDKVAIAAVRKWRFKPHEPDGQPDCIQSEVEIEFKAKR